MCNKPFGTLKMAYTLCYYKRAVGGCENRPSSGRDVVVIDKKLSITPLSVGSASLSEMMCIVPFYVNNSQYTTTSIDINEVS